MHHLDRPLQAEGPGRLQAGQGVRKAELSCVGGRQGSLADHLIRIDPPDGFVFAAQPNFRLLGIQNPDLHRTD